ncbi:MAG: hypothetical protein U0794_01385 [Isosphaeraceae bacterium]
MLQPFPEGVTTRRTTLMACLAHARPVVTSLGPKSDPFWKDCLAVVLTPAGDAPALAREGLALIQDPAARARLGATAVSVYEAHFSIDRAISALLDEVDAPAGKLPVRLASAVS